MITSFRVAPGRGAVATLEIGGVTIEGLEIHRPRPRSAWKLTCPQGVAWALARLCDAKHRERIRAAMVAAYEDECVNLGEPS